MYIGWSMKMNMYLAVTLFWMSLSLSGCVRILDWPLPSCSQQGLKCRATTSYCMDKDWLVSNKYTPSAPEDFEVEVDTRTDKKGDIFPVIVARWKARDDGNIQSLNATELQVLVMSTNQLLCVRYSFGNVLPMRNLKNDKWSFTVDYVVVEPEESYTISVSNLPKPELFHTSYDVSKTITLPGCEDPKIRRSKICVDSGSFWKSNVTLSRGAQSRSSLDVVFSTHELSERYRVLVSCSSTNKNQQWKDANKNNQTSLIIPFNLERFPVTCCQFDVQIQPFFPQCMNDCHRQLKTFHVCPPEPTKSPDYVPYVYPVLGVVACCLLGVCCVIGVLCRRKKPLPDKGSEKKQILPDQPPKILVIYSQDHHLYRDIVLKLCAFLQAKCGVEVLVDLLDNTWVGTVGRLRWLEWQRHQLKGPSDKVLVLCSRGVQAKWRAVCGQGQVMLREDVRSPTDDMLIPFLNLFLPDMHQPAAHGKYLVAYFDDVCDERDVPSVFDLGVKYKLMKHFEALCFRMLNIDQYQQGQVNHIEGIGGDEYFNCPSGRALRDAIEAFHAYQVENPDWFEMECVESEEEVCTESQLLIDQLQIPPVLENVPLIREGSPLLLHEVSININNDSVYIITPELSQEWDEASVTELRPKADRECQPLYSQHPLVVAPPRVLNTPLQLDSYSPEPVYVVQPALNEPPQHTEKWLQLREQSADRQEPTEDEESDSLVSPNESFSMEFQRLMALHQHLSPIEENSSSGMEMEDFPHLEVMHSQPIEMEEGEVMEPSGKGPRSGSDQGYISKMSSQQVSPYKDDDKDPLVALAKLQEELLMNNFSVMYAEMS